MIAALGIVYGTLVGGLLGSLGLVTGGLLGYALMLTSARRFAQRFTGPRSLQKMERLFDRGGAWAIILTRSLPYSVPEAVVFLAGLARMPLRKFAAALIIGSVPTAFAFAAIGAGWADQPVDGPRGELRAPHRPSAHRALSHAAAGTVEMSTLVIVLRIVSLLAFAGPMLLLASGRHGEPRKPASQEGGSRAPVVANLSAFGLFVPSLLIFRRQL